eukprot:scaffold108758_cov30-Tisochrysis_lutea.AAC.2
MLCVPPHGLGLGLSRSRGFHHDHVLSARAGIVVASGTSEGQNILFTRGGEDPPPRNPKWERSNGDRPTVTGRPSSRSSKSTAMVSPPLPLVASVRTKWSGDTGRRSHRCFMPSHSGVSCFIWPRSMAASPTAAPNVTQAEVTENDPLTFSYSVHLAATPPHRRDSLSGSLTHESTNVGGSPGNTIKEDVMLCSAPAPTGSSRCSRPSPRWRGVGLGKRQQSAASRVVQDTNLLVTRGNLAHPLSKTLALGTEECQLLGKLRPRRTDLSLRPWSRTLGRRDHHIFCGVLAADELENAHVIARNLEQESSNRIGRHFRHPFAENAVA